MSHQSDFDIQAIANRVLDKIKSTTDVVPDELRVCRTPDWTLASELTIGNIYCDGVYHLRIISQRRSESVGECTAQIGKRISGRIGQETERLNSSGFDGFDVTRHPTVHRAFRVAKDFSQERPPRRNIILSGQTGLGKTRLLKAAHIELLSFGVNSHYVTTPELRDWFFRSASYDESVREEGERRLFSLRQARVICFDDVGQVEDDQRRRGSFTEGFRSLLDLPGIAWAFTTMHDDEALRKHPDVGAACLSRMLENSIVVRLKGEDFRIESAKVTL